VQARDPAWGDPRTRSPMYAQMEEEEEEGLFKATAGGGGGGGGGGGKFIQS